MQVTKAEKSSVPPAATAQAPPPPSLPASPEPLLLPELEPLPLPELEPLLLPELEPLLLPELEPLLLPELEPLPLPESVPASSFVVPPLSPHAPTPRATPAMSRPMAIVFALLMCDQPGFPEFGVLRYGKTAWNFDESTSMSSVKGTPPAGASAAGRR